jgi:hypothetical protein
MREEIYKNDFSFEGFVLQMDDGSRVKIKNKYYLIQHALKYRGWIKATPKLMLPLICDSMIDAIIDNIPFCPILERHVAHYKLVIQNEYDKIDELINDNVNIKSPKEYINKLSDDKLFLRWKKLFMYLFNNPNTNLMCEWNNSRFTPLITSNLFVSKKNIFVNENHPNKPCIPDLKKYNNSQMSDNAWTCYCGCKMNIVLLKKDLSIYNTCCCGDRFGTYTYRSGMHLLICPECYCTHEVNRYTHQPLGFPASNTCKELRLYIHKLMDGHPKDEMYKLIEKITNKNDPHIALMNISNCVDIINVLEKL